MKKSMRKVLMFAGTLALATAAASQSPYPHRSSAEKFGCRETALAQFVGKAPSADIARQLLTSSGAKKLRWLQANQQSRSNKNGRVTAQLDAQGRIATAFCG